MRIRSIKPEFWIDEDLSKLPAETVLLAAALNNYSDDEGYFPGNPRLMDGQLFPLRDLSVKTTESLKELTRIGWIEIREVADGRQVGRLCHFARDQVINRPRPSDLQPLFSAACKGGGKPHGTHTESSVNPHPGLERRGKEGKGSDGGDHGEEDPPLGKRAKKPKASTHPSEHPEPIRTRLVAIGAIHRRMESTRWTAEEFAAFRSGGLDTLSPDDFSAQIEPLRDYYAAALPPDKDIRRRDILRLLRHWPGELDRARTWQRDNDDGLTRT
jgi:hypothetical protein